MRTEYLNRGYAERLGWEEGTGQAVHTGVSKACRAKGGGGPSTPPWERKL
jgi:hypothetical protein